MSCPVCFGGADEGVRQSLNAGIGVLLGVTAIVLGLFARFFVSLVRRARAAEDMGSERKWGRVSFVEDSPGPVVSSARAVLHK